jgi:hypothetical protein
VFDPLSTKEVHALSLVVSVVNSVVENHPAIESNFEYRQRGTGNAGQERTVQKLKHVGNTLLGFEAACLTASIPVGWVAFLLSVGTG